MKILVTTGIYPPKIGGPAQYAKNLKEAFEKAGHDVRIKTYAIENKLPTGARHIFFFLKILPVLISSDIVYALDTYSVGFPSVFAAKIFRKKCIIRTGGDFLWEQYIERSRRKVLLRDFYYSEKTNFSLKERVIFFVTKWTLNNAFKVIFSTDWQRKIFADAYDIDLTKTDIVENFYGPKESDLEPKEVEFIASSRNRVWKNLNLLKMIFTRISNQKPETKLFLDHLPYDKFMERMSNCFAVILISLGDISPNMILDAIRLNRPFICTKEIGIYDRIKDAGFFVDPQNEQEIEEALMYLLTEEGYREAKHRVSSFNYVHTWQDIAREFIDTLKK